MSADDSNRSGTFWVFNPDWPQPPGLEPRLPANFARLGSAAAPTLAPVLGLADPAEVLRRFEGGRRCYAAWVEGALAAYGWVSFGEEYIGEMNLRLHLAPGEAYIWDCVTLPAYRRNRLYTALLAHIAGELRAEGLCRAWIGADADNQVSLKGIARAGFLCVADLVIDRAIAMRLLWARGRPAVPEALVENARRILLGDRDRAWLNALSPQSK